MVGQTVAILGIWHTLRVRNIFPMILPSFLNVRDNQYKNSDRIEMKGIRLQIAGFAVFWGDSNEESRHWANL